MENKLLQQALQSLNPIQHEAVISNATSLQIIAGPGSGKTKVLTCRVSYLIVEKNINPWDIIVVTFTKKAANELKERLCLLIGHKRTNLLQIGTFHSICISILRRNARIVDMEPTFKVVDDRKRKEIIRTLIKDDSLPVKYAGRQIKADIILQEIESAKERGENHIRFQNLYGGGTSYYMSVISIYYMAYEAELRRQNIMDFGGLILKTSELLKQNDDIFYKIDCILVDEFQDTSASQYDLITLIVAQAGKRTITTVGDPDQSIYGWRSAKTKVFQEMQETYSHTKVIHLEQNYRSTSKIVESANHVIVQDKGRLDKALYTNNPIGIPISLITTSNERKQAEYVANEIAKIINHTKGLIEYKDIAILMRANYISRQFERTFRLHKIPFNLKGGERFFNRMEIKHMLAYLRFVSDPYDLKSFCNIINVPERNIRKNTINRLFEMNQTFGGGMLDTIDIFLGEERVSSGDKIELQNFSDLCHSILRKIEDEEHIPEILKFIYGETKYFKHLVRHHFHEHVSCWKNLGELVTIAGSKKLKGEYEDEESGGITTITVTKEPLVIVKDESISDQQEVLSTLDSLRTTDTFENISIKKEDLSTDEEGDLSREEYILSKGVQNIQEFLNYCDSCLNQQQDKSNETGSVTLSTIHAAKGLEWPCVFIATCVKGVIPTLGDVGEEKRILYVAMTRSKFLLYCISPEELGDWGKTQRLSRTSFLDDMDKELFSTSSPVWDDKVCEMLTDTIYQRAPNYENSSREIEISKISQSTPRLTHESAPQSTLQSSPESTPKSTPESTPKSAPKSAFTLYKPYSSSTHSKTNVTTAPTYHISYATTNYSSKKMTSCSAGQKRTIDIDEQNIFIDTNVKKQPKLD